MSKPDDGGPGPAFPTSPARHDLRDYFAAQALPYFMKHCGPYGVREANWMGAGDFEESAKLAYDMADFMIAERQKGGSDGSR